MGRVEGSTNSPGAVGTKPLEEESGSGSQQQAGLKKAKAQAKAKEVGRSGVPRSGKYKVGSGSNQQAEGENLGRVRS